MKSIWGLFASTAAATCFAAAAYAECNITYTVKAGDTLASIAAAHYEGDKSKSSLIYYNNQKIISGSDLRVAEGMQLEIPCSLKDLTPDSTPLQDAAADMKLLTGGNNAPFTDQKWPGQGIITELINAAMEETPDPVSFSITWEDDWSKHLFPLLDSKQYDMGFPWFRPDCDSDPGNEICRNFHFSDPVMDLLILLYVRNGNTFDYESDEDVWGKSICYSQGYFEQQLDGDGREWLQKGLVTLMKAEATEDCFKLLALGEVDAVATNAVIGAKTIKDMGFDGSVKALSRPFSEQSLHVVISKKNWRGTTHLYRINAGLVALKASGRYNQIIFRHLGIFENSLKR
jgi:polar amino acid transport system substrate-binding protein